jgi:hypothetical protein
VTALRLKEAMRASGSIGFFDHGQEASSCTLCLRAEPRFIVQADQHNPHHAVQHSYG